jgi:hypothetical protein
MHNPWIHRFFGPKVPRLVFGVLLTIFLIGSTAEPAFARDAPKKRPWNGINIVVTSAVPKVVCVGKKITVKYQAITRGAALPTKSAPVVLPSLGDVSGDTFNAKSGKGSYVYQASKEGREATTITMSWGKAIGTADVRFEVKRCDYVVSIRAYATAKNELANAYTSFSGDGKFTLDGNGVIQGDGKVELYMNLWETTAPVNCKLNPIIEKTGTFRVMDASLAPLTGGSGQDNISIDLDFAPIPIDAVSIECVANLDNVKISPLKLPGGNFAPNDLGLKALSFPPGGGEIPFTFSNNTGTVSIRPRTSQ